jgi:cobalt-zinc-cadmium efflux system protein
VVIARASGQSLNMRGAYLHLASDAGGSLGAMAAGVTVLIKDVHRADPAISLVITALILAAAFRLLRETTHVLLEGTPSGMDPQKVQDALEADPEVDGAHHLHLWNLASDVPALSAHVVLRREVSMHEAQEKGELLKAMLRERFGIPHATLELECHVCRAASHDTHR